MKRPELTSKKSKRPDGGEPRRQYAALPWRLLGEGVEILLASSRETRRGPGFFKLCRMRSVR